MKKVFAVLFTFSFTLAGVAYAASSTSTPSVVCSALSSIGNLSGVLGCAGATSTLDLSPQVQVSLTPDALDATVTASEIIATSTTSAHAAIDTPVPLPIRACSLIVKKIVQGGTALASEFMIHVFLNGRDIAHSPQPGSVTGTQYTNIDAGTYAITETGGPTGYTASFSGDCDPNGIVHLSIDQSAVCTVTNIFATSTATSTPGGGGGNGGGGGSGGGGGGGTSGGGGGGSPVPPPSGSGGNGPTPVTIASAGTVVTAISGLAAVAPSPQSEEEAASPGIPNTGENGVGAWISLTLSACAGITALRSLRHRGISLKY